MTIWYFDEPAKVVSLPGHDDVEPLLRLHAHAGEGALPDHRLQHRLVVLEAEIDSGRTAMRP